MDGCATIPNQLPQSPCTSARPPYVLSQQATSISSSPPPPLPPPPSCCARFCGLQGIPLVRPGCVTHDDMVLRGAALGRPIRKVLLLLLLRAVSGSGDRIRRLCSNSTRNSLLVARRSTWGLPAPYLSTGPNSQSASSLPCLPRLSGFAAAVHHLGAAACTSPGNEPCIALAHNAHFDAGAFAQHSRSTNPVTLGVTAF
ncbi:hypothetical protein COCMIDRAFT_37509 [Bipolaris oryzae ATCC 44560]|uniref:Uncharacterized protein n=1 Tax=Bipolaris oryzae ATCC 44560 TaxID=930090 RepID=W6Z4N7_COCMI|nr:uncharacterized protein COCMIDRAFT_37509 [Bipolaris oryzae ATCC 44560]EUC44688.1 hypothetical protein COCMIDRAFT_37509 [Bipolaris oryzae ATCC 44560]